MSSKIVIGIGDLLDIVGSAWPSNKDEAPVERREILQGADYAFDYNVFDGLDSSEVLLFIAVDERFGNFKRLELMQAAVSRGYKLATICAPHSVIAADAKLGPNVFIGLGAVVNNGSIIDFNTIVNSGAIIGYGARVKSSCWIEGGVSVGNRAEIGSHSILRSGSVIAPQVKVGRHCEIGIPGVYQREIATKTILDPRFDGPINVYGS